MALLPRRYLDPSDIAGNLQNPAFTTITLNGLFYESAQDGLTAYASGGQANATPLPYEMNRVSTVAAANASVLLPASAPGLTIVVDNSGANPMQVFGSGTDTINGVAYGTGVSQMVNSIVIYTCYTAGAWYAANLGTGFAGSLETQSYTMGLTAYSAGGQANATPLTAMMNQVTTAGAAGASVVLPASAPGLQIAVINNGGNSINVFCPSGSTMNGVSNSSSSLANSSVGIYFCFSSTAWVSK